MVRETSLYVIGDYWLDKRRDGRSPDIWQIAWYDAASRTVLYRSTRKRELEDAKAAIYAFDQRQRAKGKQDVDDAEVIPLLFLYWEEHGRSAVSPAQIASSLRQFIAFLLQDEVGEHVTVAQITPQMFTRFRQWRMAPHSYEIPWYGKLFQHSSKGVNGESVQRNLDDIRAAMNHHTKNGRLPYAPMVPSVPETMRSPAKDVRLTVAQMGAIVGFSDEPLRRFVLLMVATAVRPEAAHKFDPALQCDFENGLINLHPPGALRTKKRNPTVPMIDPFRPVLQQWAAEGPAAVKSRKTAWRTMRRALKLADNIEPKTIRHTIATMLRSRGAPALQISGLLGHVMERRTTAVYAKYDPLHMIETKALLATIFNEVIAASEVWLAGHLRYKTSNAPTIVVAREPEKA